MDSFFALPLLSKFLFQHFDKYLTTELELCVKMRECRSS